MRKYTFSLLSLQTSSLTIIKKLDRKIWVDDDYKKFLSSTTSLFLIFAAYFLYTNVKNLFSVSSKK